MDDPLCRKNLGLHNLASYLDGKMEDCVAESKASVPAQPPDPATSGRIGPPDVILDILSNVGTLIMEPDRLGVGFLIQPCEH